MANTEIASMAGGCFWGMEHLIQKIPGVKSTRVGYTGGNFENPTYNDMKKGTTGHAEAVSAEHLVGMALEAGEICSQLELAHAEAQAASATQDAIRRASGGGA